jgi:lysophospholipase L1-like esterase
MAVLEQYEWSDMWWDEPAQGGHRVLLVGDSITRGYRQLLKELAENNCYIDMFATSRALDNPAYFRELSCMISNCLNYTTVHLNNGLHGFHQSIETYAKYYEKLINFFQEGLKDAQLVLALTTPVTKPGIPEAYAERNKTVVERNQVLRLLAEKYNLPLDDLYTPVDGNSTLKAPDGVHFTEKGYQLLARQVLPTLKKFGELSMGALPGPGLPWGLNRNPAKRLQKTGNTV